MDLKIEWIIRQECISPPDRREGSHMRGMKPVKIYSCTDRVSADMIVGALQEAGIDAYRQSQGSGDYMDLYMGTSVFGEDVYVDEENAAFAKEIIAGITLPAAENGSASPEDAPDAEQCRRNQRPVRIACLICAAILISFVVFSSLFSILFG